MEAAKLAGIIITVGSVLPLLTSIVQQRAWSTRTRTIVAVILSTLAGLVTYVTQYGLDFSNTATLITTIIGVILAAGTAYKTVWQPSGVAPALEGRTSKTAAKADAEQIEGGDEDEPEIAVIDADDVPEYQPAELAEPLDFDDGSAPGSVTK